MFRKCIVAALLAAGALTGSAFAAEPSVLDFKLGQTFAETQALLDSLKADYPTVRTYRGKDETGQPYVAAIDARDRSQAQLLFLQFTPPFDGSKLVVVDRHVVYNSSNAPGYPASPTTRELKKALFDRYGNQPLEIYVGDLGLIWTFDNLTANDDYVLSKCYRSMQHGDNQPEVGVRGCGRTVQVQIANDSSFKSRVLSLRTLMIDQNHLADTDDRFRQLMEQAQQKGNQPNAAPPPKL